MDRGTLTLRDEGSSELITLYNDLRKKNRDNKAEALLLESFSFKVQPVMIYNNNRDIIMNLFMIGNINKNFGSVNIFSKNILSFFNHRCPIHS